MSEDLTKLVHSYEFAEPQIVGNVAMVGLLSEAAPAESPVISLRSALRKKTINITEGPGGYTQLNAKAEIPTLVRSSEGISKAGKQDRVTKRSEVVRDPVTLNVYCIEHGRWRAGKKEWVPINLPTPLRRAIMAQRDQSEIWGMITEYLREWKIDSRSDALSAIFDALGQRFEKFVANFEWWPHQVGMIVCINGVPSGLELFGAKDLFRDDGMHLLRESYVPEALRGERVPILPGEIPDMINRLFDEVRENQRHVEIVHYNGDLAYATVI